MSNEEEDTEYISPPESFTDETARAALKAAYAELDMREAPGEPEGTGPRFQTSTSIPGSCGSLSGVLFACFTRLTRVLLAWLTR